MKILKIQFLFLSVLLSLFACSQTGVTYNDIKASKSFELPTLNSFPAKAKKGNIIFLNAIDTTAGYYGYNGATWAKLTGGTGGIGGGSAPLSLDDVLAIGNISSRNITAGTIYSNGAKNQLLSSGAASFGSGAVAVSSAGTFSVNTPNNYSGSNSIVFNGNEINLKSSNTEDGKKSGAGFYTQHDGLTSLSLYAIDSSINDGNAGRISLAGTVDIASAGPIGGVNYASAVRYSKYGLNMSNGINGATRLLTINDSGLTYYDSTNFSHFKYNKKFRNATARSVPDWGFIDSAITARVVVGGGVPDGNRGHITVSSGGTSWQVNNDAIGGAQLAANAVGNSEIIDGSVNQPKIALGAVGTNQLADASVTAAKINATGGATGKVLSYDNLWISLPSGGSNITSSGNVKPTMDGSGIRLDITFSGKIADTTILPNDPATFVYRGHMYKELDKKQNLLTSGISIKTVNNESILGAGNINIAGGGSNQWSETSTALSTLKKVGIGIANPDETLEVRYGSGGTETGISGFALWSNSPFLSKLRFASNYDIAYIGQNWFYNGVSTIADNPQKPAATMELSAYESNDGHIDFYTSNTNNAGKGNLNMRLTKDGNIGIGTNTANPSARLALQTNNNNVGIALNDADGSPSWYLNKTANFFSIETPGLGQVPFRAMYSSGYIGINNGNPQYQMDVTGTLRATAIIADGITSTSDVEVTNLAKGIILKSPNGNRFRISVQNDGTLTTTQL